MKFKQIILIISLFATPCYPLKIENISKDILGIHLVSTKYNVSILTAKDMEMAQRFGLLIDHTAELIKEIPELSTILQIIRLNPEESFEISPFKISLACSRGKIKRRIVKLLIFNNEGLDIDSGDILLGDIEYFPILEVAIGAHNVERTLKIESGDSYLPYLSET